jgi:hypothetical protein
MLTLVTNVIHVDLLVQAKRRSLRCARLAIYYTLAHSMFHRPLKFAFFVLLYFLFFFIRLHILNKYVIIM